MKLRRSLLAAAAPVASTLLFAGPALASAPQVSFRVEGAKRTLLETRTVTPPSSGSITKDGTPSGTCPADSAAGALSAATHGRWSGTYSSGLGIEVTNILGTTALYTKGSYWDFFVNDRPASEGVCDTKLKAGDQFLFAQVPAKGKAELPVVMRAPSTVRAGRPFTVRTFVYTGKGSATRAVKPSLTAGGSAAKTGSLKLGPSRSGVSQVTFSSAGTATLVASAKGEIRSAATTIKVTG